MLGWRKKRDGFEWHDYVRTTILVRRAKRRQKVDDVRAAAVDGIKDAGAAAAHGLNEAKGAAAEGFRRAGEMGQAFGASGASAAANLMHRTWAGLGTLMTTIRTSGAAGTRSIASRLAQLAAAILAPLLFRLSDRRTRTVVGAVGVAAFFAVAYRVWAVGFDARAMFAALLGLLTLGPALLAERHRDDVTHRISSHDNRKGKGTQGNSSPAPVSMKWLSPVLVWGGLAALVVLGIGTLIRPGGIQSLPTIAAITHPSTTPAPSRPDLESSITGRARAISGDILRVGRTQIKLNHIAAPETGQTCARSNGQTWRCGEAARKALAKYLSGARIACTITNRSSADGIAHGDCKKGDTDLAEALVRDGHVFAESGFFARHASLESKARENHSGLWDGDALRPETFRTAAWEAARQKAPDACPIKGRVASREKLYVMPWMQGYDSIKIRESRGERWFCSEEDARQAGWRPSGA